MNNLSNVFVEAADLLEPKGSWCRHVYGRKNGVAVKSNDTRNCDQRCMVGAIRCVTEFSGNKKKVKLRAEAERMLAAAVPTAPMNWNDDPARTQEEVVALLRELSGVPDYDSYVHYD